MKQAILFIVLFSFVANAEAPPPKTGAGVTTANAQPGNHNGGKEKGGEKKPDPSAYNCEVANYASTDAKPKSMTTFQVPKASSVAIDDAEPQKVQTEDGKGEIEYRAVRKDGKITIRMKDTKGKISYAEGLDGLMLGMQLPLTKQILQCRPPVAATVALCAKENPTKQLSTSETDYEFSADPKFSVAPGTETSPDWYEKAKKHTVKDDGGIDVTFQVARTGRYVVAQFTDKRADTFNVSTDDGAPVSYRIAGREKALTGLAPKGGLKEVCDRRLSCKISKMGAGRFPSWEPPPERSDDS